MKSKMKSLKYGYTQEIIFPIIIIATIITGVFNFYVLKQQELIIKDINSFIIDYKSKEKKLPDIYTLKSNDNNKNIKFEIEENEKFYIIKNFIDFTHICSPLTNTKNIDDLTIICEGNDIYILK